MEGLKQYAFKEFTASEVCQILRQLLGERIKIGLPLINFYTRSGLIVPTGKTIYRKKRKYSFYDLVLFYWLFRMKREGVHLSKFKSACEILRKKIKSKKDLLSFVLATDGERIYVRSGKSVNNLVGQILSGKNRGQYIWIFGFKNIADELKSVVAQTQY
ncbi:MAG: hypothetical protein NZT61_00270 [Deltaproteobacteria bacterium]|nr:hypothetical protein [Deltaproteobacteria bacterium]MCX7952871.1 hypothetical protein [Deltaproteobacteria bacterium]